MNSNSNVTQLLSEVQAGQDGAVDRLWSEVYDELRTLAQHRMRGERNDHTFNTTDLVHECYLRLVDQSEVEWESRLHFFALASRVMRNILIDYARRKKAQKRGGDAPHLSLDDVMVSGEGSAEIFLALDEALKKLEEVDERMAQVVEYRFFGGLQEKEIAEIMDLSPRTIRRDWRKARAWLSKALQEDDV